MTTTHTIPDMPAALKRQTDKRGITLSAGITATGSKGDIKDKAVDQATKSEPTSVEPARLGGSKAKNRKERKAAERAASPAPKAEPTTTPEPVIDAATPEPVIDAATPEPVIDAATGQPLVKVRRSIVPMRFKERYSKHNGTCGDDMALELKATTTVLNADKRETLDKAVLATVAAANGLDAVLAGYVAKNLNNGQLRMNIGNKLRGLLAAGKDVTVGTRTFKAEDFQPRA